MVGDTKEYCHVGNVYGPSMACGYTDLCRRTTSVVDAS